VVDQRRAPLPLLSMRSWSSWPARRSRGSAPPLLESEDEGRRGKPAEIELPGMEVRLEHGAMAAVRRRSSTAQSTASMWSPAASVGSLSTEAWPSKLRRISLRAPPCSPPDQAALLPPPPSALPVQDLRRLHGGEVRRGSIPKLGSSEAAAAAGFPLPSSSSLASLRGSGEAEPLLHELGAEVAGRTAPAADPCSLRSRRRPSLPAADLHDGGRRAASPRRLPPLRTGAVARGSCSARSARRESRCI
jgi:hypothetical protein